MALKRSCGDLLPGALTCTLSLDTDFRNSRLFSAWERKPSNSAWTLLGLYARSQMSLVLAAASVLQKHHMLRCCHYGFNKHFADYQCNRLASQAGKDCESPGGG